MFANHKMRKVCEHVHACVWACRPSIETHPAAAQTQSSVWCATLLLFRWKTFACVWCINFGFNACAFAVGWLTLPLDRYAQTREFNEYQIDSSVCRRHSFRKKWNEKKIYNWSKCEDVQEKVPMKKALSVVFAFSYIASLGNQWMTFLVLHICVHTEARTAEWRIWFGKSWMMGFHLAGCFRLDEEAKSPTDERN